MKKQLLAAVLTLSAASAYALISAETKDVATRLGAVDTIEISFDTGSSTLSDAQKKELARSVKARRTQRDCYKSTG